MHAQLLLSSPPRPVREGERKRSGWKATAPGIIFRAWSERQDLCRPIPSPPRPARGGSRDSAALTGEDPPLHLHLPPPPRPMRDREASERVRTCRKKTAADLLEGVVELIAVSSSGHRSKQRAGSNPRPQISPPRSGYPTTPGTKPTTSKQLRQLNLHLATPAALLRLLPAIPARKARESPGLPLTTFKAGGGERGGGRGSHGRMEPTRSHPRRTSAHV
jgi:hypothetical protein